jgi:O-antigen ligase
MHIKTSPVEAHAAWSQRELAHYFMVAGLTYVLIFTPVNMVSYTTVIIILLLLSAIAQGSFFQLVRTHLKTLAVITVFLVANAAFSPLPKEAFTGAFNVFKGLWILPVAMLASNSFTEERFRRVALPLSIVSAVIALGLLLFVVDWEAPYQSLETWSGSRIGNLHNLNNFLFISLLLAGVVAWQYRSTGTRLVSVCALLPLLLMCVLVQSGGSVLALGSTLLLLAGLRYRNRFGYSLMAFAFLPVLLLQFFYVFPEQFSSVTGLQASTLHIRSQIYSQLLEAWSQHPFIGWGATTYKYAEATAVNGRQFLYPHNLYLEALFSFGILGSLLLAGWISCALRQINLRATVQNPATAFALATMAYLSIKGMSDMKLTSYHTVGLFSVCFGLLLGSPGNIANSLHQTRQK